MYPAITVIFFYLFLDITVFTLLIFKLSCYMYMHLGYLCPFENHYIYPPLNMRILCSDVTLSEIKRVILVSFLLHIYMIYGIYNI